MAGLPRKVNLGLEPRWACLPQFLTPFTSAQICCRVICNARTACQKRHLVSRITNGCIGCDVTLMSHRSPVRILPKVAITVTRRGYTDIVLMGAIASQTAITTGTIVMDWLWKEYTKMILKSYRHLKKQQKYKHSVCKKWFKTKKWFISYSCDDEMGSFHYFKAE